MPLPLPNLDDRRWADLVEEGRALIPLYAPEWTDHNVHDPGITLIELFAWMAEMDIYQLNQVPEQHRRKFLALIGLPPQPPRPARTVLRFTLQTDSAALALPAKVELPARVEFEGLDPFGQPTRFRTLDEVTVVASELQAIQLKDQKGFQDLTRRWERGEPFSLFGDDPQPGTALYLGFSQTLPANDPVSLFFTFDDLQTGKEERDRLISEISAQRAACRPADSLVACQERPPASIAPEVPATLPHHSAHTVWEFLARQDQWLRLEPGSAQITDETRAFTLNGRVLINLPVAMAKAHYGHAESELYYLRCRFVGGAYDAAPVLRNLAVNALLAEQAAPPDALTLTMPGDPDVKAELLGYGTGMPCQRLTSSERPVLESSFRLFTVEDGTWRPWTQRPDFDASDRSDLHFVLDPTLGLVTFGDGDRGRVVPAKVQIVASYLATRAEEGNLAAGTVTKLADSPHNRAVLHNFDDAQDQLAAHKENPVPITNPVPAMGGTAAETLAHSEGRAVEVMEGRNRAVTLADYEFFAKRTPGARLARVSARANLHPGFPCLQAPGIIAVLILPYLPVDRPLPSTGLQSMVRAYLARHRVLGTRVEVFGPTYLDVAVRATVQGRPEPNAANLKERISAALNRFFHPLLGGTDGQGWPFGRDVYRSEVLQVIDETDGVEHVLSLELIAGGGEPQCGNICIGPTGLVAAGQHQIEVVSR
jgi:predicted phage baseplate assembly protein